MFKTNDYWEEEFEGYKVKDLDSIDFDNCTSNKVKVIRSYLLKI